MPDGFLSIVIVSDERLHLPEVTLVAVTSVAIEATAQAMRRSLEKVRFGAAVWCSDQPPPAVIADAVAWHAIAPLTTRDAYSRFMLSELADHVSTSHALSVQWDGYVLDPAAWEPSFLDHDYIGAVWPHFNDDCRVGNGGFSLRSRRLLDVCRALPERFADSGATEDKLICRTARSWLETAHGIRFAPEALARRFAFEREPKAGSPFGFHGVFNLVDLIDGAASARLLAGIEPRILAKSEHRELLRWAFARREWQVARVILLRMLRRKTARRT